MGIVKKCLCGLDLKVYSKYDAVQSKMERGGRKHKV
jgi:hypothetical protein